MSQVKRFRADHRHVVETEFDDAQFVSVSDYDALQQRLTVAEQRESEAREELLDLSRKLDVFYSRSHGIKNLSAIEDANDKSKALQQRLTVAEQRAAYLKKLLCDVISEAPTGFAALKVDLAHRVNDALKPADHPQ